MFLLFEVLIRERSDLVYIDYVLLMSNSRIQMLQLIEQFCDEANQGNLELAAEKTFLMLLTVKHPGWKIGFNKFKQVQSKIAAFH